MKFQTLVVDDEPLARKRVVDLLAGDATVNITDECKNGYEAITILHRKPCDLLFLDIQMPDIDGFGVIESMDAAKMPATVFVTAYDKYALKAFSVNAIDYLLKPFDDNQFFRALTNAKMSILNHKLGEINSHITTLTEYIRDNNLRYGGLLSDEGVSAGIFQEKFAIRNNGKILLIKTSSVQWIESTGNYVCLHTMKGRHLIRAKISALQEKLDPCKFIRIHRSTIINVDFIQEIEKCSHAGYIFKMNKGDKISSSHNYNSAINRFLKNIS